MKGFKKGNRVRTVFLIFNTVFMIFLCAAVLIPLIKYFGSTLTDSYAERMSIRLIPKEANWSAWKSLFSYKGPNGYFAGRIVKRFALSLGITCVTTLLGVFLSAISAYILTQKDMPGSKLLGRAILFAAIFNLGITPEFLVMKKLYLLNTLWAVILPMCINAYCIFYLRSCFEKLPKSIIEAAELDGCTPVNTFFSVVLPVFRGPLTVTAGFFAAAAWNEYFRYVVYIDSMSKYNIQYTIRDLLGIWEEYFAIDPYWYSRLVTVICAVPAIFICLAVMRHYKPDVKLEILNE